MKALSSDLLTSHPNFCGCDTQKHWVQPGTSKTDLGGQAVESTTVTSSCGWIVTRLLFTSVHVVWWIRISLCCSPVAVNILYTGLVLYIFFLKYTFVIFSIIYLLLSVWVKAAFSLDFPPTMRLPVKQRPSVVIEETSVSFVLSSCGLTLTLLCEPWRHWDFKIFVKVRLKSELQVKNNSWSC